MASKQRFRIDVDLGEPLFRAIQKARIAECQRTGKEVSRSKFVRKLLFAALGGGLRKGTVPARDQTQGSERGTQNPKS